MNLRSALRNKKWRGAAIGLLLSVGLGLFLHRYKLGSALVNHSYDLLLILRGEIAAQEAVVVYMDEISHTTLGQPLNASFSRTLHARLIDGLTKAGAKAIVFDIVFTDPSPGPGGKEMDEELARAIRESGRVILAADLGQRGIKQNKIDPPLDILLQHAGGMGYAEMNPDSDFIIRQHTPCDPDWCPTLSWAAADFLKAPAMQKLPYSQTIRWMNYYGPNNFLNWARYYEALEPEKFDSDFFSNKVVFVGARLLTKFANDRKDEYSGPFAFWITDKRKGELGNRFMAGVEIQATAFLNLLRGDWLTRLPYNTEQVLIIALGLVFGLGLVLLRPIIATVAGVGGGAIVAMATFVVFKEKLLWWPWLIAEVQIGLALIWAIVFNSIQLYVQTRLLEQTIGLYVSPKLVKKFSRDPKMLKPGAEKQMLTILFSDIAGFTTISEGLDSDELARMMNVYFQTAVTHCIHHTEGTVVKYIGDAIFAFWNAPEDQTDHQVRACGAALKFRDQEVQYINGHPLHTRIGLHTGVANVGNFGSTARIDYTALGENINLASRMEGLNKHLGTTVLITGQTKAGLGDQFLVRPLGLFRLKGFEKSVEVYELVDLTPAAEKSRPWRESFAQGLKAYQQKDFVTAEAAFARTLEIQPKDGPSTFYLARIDELRGEILPDDWKCDVELKEK